MNFVPYQVQDLLLEFGLENVAETLIEGLSRVKRCTDEGRALMSLDLQVFLNDTTARSFTIDSYYFFEGGNFDQPYYFFTNIRDAPYISGLDMSSNKECNGGLSDMSTTVKQVASQNYTFFISSYNKLSLSQVLINGLKHFVSVDVRPKMQIVETFIKVTFTSSIIIYLCRSFILRM